jgi:hypothetical protein
MKNLGLKNILGLNAHFKLPEGRGVLKQSFKVSLQNRKVTARISSNSSSDSAYHDTDI